MSAEPTWRVYLQEWLTVYTAGYMGDPGKRECWEHFDRKYAGRVQLEDRKVVSEAPGWFPALKLRLFNRRGEFKDPAEADREATRIFDPPAGCTPEVVRRGSAEEQALLDYGKKMLPDAG